MVSEKVDVRTSTAQFRTASGPNGLREQRAYPGALLHAAVGLAKRRKDLAIDHELSGEAHEDWRNDLDTLFLDGTMFNETVFLHRPSRSLIVADVIENFETSSH